MSYIFGYTNFIDGSARGLPVAGFYSMKSRATYAPIGPFITTADEIADPYNLQVRLWNNEELMQDYSTADMAVKIDECIEFVTKAHEMEPGDILALGTNHRGLHPFQDGAPGRDRDRRPRPPAHRSRTTSSAPGRARPVSPAQRRGEEGPCRRSSRASTRRGTSLCWPLYFEGEGACRSRRIVSN